MDQRFHIIQPTRELWFCDYSNPDDDGDFPVLRLDAIIVGDPTEEQPAGEVVGYISAPAGLVRGEPLAGAGTGGGRTSGEAAGRSPGPEPG